ncbi:allophanate hydrolase-related protein [Guyparkeria halopsychrophila]|uniref:allophanate hydrolase-related protein n=1 Tax=Guyparkeria halopsychrophila TaxID=3139421 RepID=UPI0037C83F97
MPPRKAARPSPCKSLARARHPVRLIHQRRPDPLPIGKLALTDGRRAAGFGCASVATHVMTDITHLGFWHR